MTAVIKDDSPADQTLFWRQGLQADTVLDLTYISLASVNLSGQGWYPAFDDQVKRHSRNFIDCKVRLGHLHDNL